MNQMPRIHPVIHGESTASPAPADRRGIAHSAEAGELLR